MNERLAKQRAVFFEDMDRYPENRKLFIQAALAEGGDRNLLANFEQMMNYGNARAFITTYEILHSGFFGPVNRGEAQQHVITAHELDLANQALEEVKAGSNILDYRTDQGMKGDPNYAKEQNPIWRPTTINGNFFADHPMFGEGNNSWAARQKLLDAQLTETAKVSDGPLTNTVEIAKHAAEATAAVAATAAAGAADAIAHPKPQAMDYYIPNLPNKTNGVVVDPHEVVAHDLLMLFGAVLNVAMADGIISGWFYHWVIGALGMVGGTVVTGLALFLRRTMIKGTNENVQHIMSSGNAH